MYKILVVDDSRTVLSLLKSELHHHQSIEAIYAQDHKEAMQKIREHQGSIKAAILDYNLPDAPNGEVVLLANSHNIPSVVLTGTLDEKVKDIILKSNVIDFILKNDPTSIPSAINSIERVLKNYETNVLIVDDSAVYRQVLSKSLQQMHLNVIEAKDGLEAIEIIESSQEEITLVITDYEMPRMDGIQLTFKLREKYNKDKLGIIAISGSEHENTIYKFLKFGANDFINKPFTHNEVVTTVNANLELLDLFNKMKNLANKDFLTGAYNRRYFFESGTAIFLKEKRKNKPMAVAMLDIDKFKNINDTYGHDVGDVAIKEIKRILDTILRRSDLMARFGGEEFCILLEDISLEDTHKLFEKIRKSFEDNSIDIGSKKLSYTISIGVFYGLSVSLEEMIRLSDEALYFAKENGRNQVKINTSEA